MIYIVEIPHHAPAMAWVAKDQADLLRVADALATRNGEFLETYEGACEWLLRDLHCGAIFGSFEEAATALQAGRGVFAGHQSAKAAAALKAQLDAMEWHERILKGEDHTNPR